jgi:hypothetical protein
VGRRAFVHGSTLLLSSSLLVAAGLVYAFRIDSVAQVREGAASAGECAAAGCGG